ncbi:MAG: MucR family transcriptional regulator [Alphaproteobacteria bacterium]
MSNKKDLLAMTSNIVSAYVAYNRVDIHEMPNFIKEIYATLDSVDSGESSLTGVQPAVDIASSVTDDYIICLEDGEKLKMLKRHLQSLYGLSPEEYRRKWDLPADYPMVAPNYAKKRSKLAKQIGLGSKENRG